MTDGGTHEWTPRCRTDAEFDELMRMADDACVRLQHPHQLLTGKMRYLRHCAEGLVAAEEEWDRRHD